MALDALTAEERENCILHLMQRRPSILTLGEDVLEVISFRLSDKDRMAFLKAVAPRQCDTEPGALRVYFNRYPSLAAFLCYQRAHEILLAKLTSMGDRLLYQLTPPTTKCREASNAFLIICNWSIFATRVMDPIAMIHWSRTPPHARVDIQPYITKLTTAFNLANYSPILRLSAYRTVNTREAGMRVHVHGVVMRITEEPILVEELDLYADNEGALDNVRWLMMNTASRQAMLSVSERQLIPGST